MQTISPVANSQTGYEQGFEREELRMDMRKVDRFLLVSSAALQHRQKLGEDVCRLHVCILGGHSCFVRTQHTGDGDLLQ